MKITVDTSISYYSIEKLMCALFGQLCIVGTGDYMFVEKKQLCHFIKCN